MIEAVGESLPSEDEIRNNAEQDMTHPEDEAMSFSYALELLKQGCDLIRKGWPDKGVFVRIIMPYEDQAMTIPYFYKNTMDMECEGLKGVFPWTPTHDDILAEDWELLV